MNQNSPFKPNKPAFPPRTAKGSDNLCESCRHCTHSPNLFQPYWWCSYSGREIKTVITQCKHINQN
nr:MAG TPA: hypothetical protein [Caudoviricetes sp.]